MLRGFFGNLSFANFWHYLLKCCAEIILSSFKAGRVHELLNNAIFISHQNFTGGTS